MEKQKHLKYGNRNSDLETLKQKQRNTEKSTMDNWPSVDKSLQIDQSVLLISSEKISP